MPTLPQNQRASDDEHSTRAERNDRLNAATKTHKPTAAIKRMSVVHTAKRIGTRFGVEMSEH